MSREHAAASDPPTSFAPGDQRTLLPASAAPSAVPSAVPSAAPAAGAAPLSSPESLQGCEVAGILTQRRSTGPARSMEVDSNTPTLASGELANGSVSVTLNVEGADRLLQLVSPVEGEGGGALLADEMGVGKTHTTLLLLWRLFSSGSLTTSRPALLVAPARILEQWREEGERWSSQHAWHSMLDSCVTVDAQTIAPCMSGSALCAVIHMASYADFTNPVIFGDLATYDYRVAVFDEARGFEDPSSRTAVNIRDLRNSVAARLRQTTNVSFEPLFVVALIGTPTGVNPQNAANMLSLLNNAEVEPCVDAIASAYQALAVRRLLPTTCHVERVLVCVPLKAHQRLAYQAALLAGVRAGGVGGGGDCGSIAGSAAELRRLCQFAPAADTVETGLGDVIFGSLTYTQLLEGSSKLQYFDTWLRAALAREEHVLVFAYSRIVRLLLQAYVGCITGDPGPDVPVDLIEALGSAAVPFIYGHAPSNLTSRAVRWFEAHADESGRRSRLMVLSAIAGGRGLNLPSADAIFIFDVLQSARMVAQVEARAIRRNRHPTKALTVVQALAADTLEEGLHVSIWAQASLALALSSGLSASSPTVADSGCDCDSDLELKRRLLEGTPLLCLNSYAFGLCWREGDKPDVKACDVTGELGAMVSEIARGCNCFHAEDCHRLLGDVHLSPTDYVCLPPPPFGSKWQWLKAGRPAKACKLGEGLLYDALRAKVRQRSALQFSTEEWSTVGVSGLRRNHFVEIDGEFFLPVKLETRWLYPSDWSGHDLVGAQAALVRDYARRPLHATEQMPLLKVPHCLLKPPISVPAPPLA